MSSTKSRLPDIGPCPCTLRPLQETNLGMRCITIRVGAVLSHQLEDGSERPIAFTSRLLAPAKKYSQLDKEGLAMVFGVKSFHKYILGWASVHHSL